MHVVITTVGTHGDARPYVALGSALVAEGHRVTLATHAEHEPLVRSRALGFREIGASFKEILESPGGRAWLESSDSLLRYLRLTREVMIPPARTWLQGAYDAARDADVVVMHPFTPGAWNAAEKRGIPAAYATPYPMVESGEIAPMSFPNVPRWSWLRRRLGAMTLRAIGDLMRDDVRGQRAHVGLPEMPRDMLRALVLERGVPTLGLWSPSVVPAPSDWPAHVEVTGYCFVDRDASWVPPRELASFVEAEPAPIYVGFGSMTGRDPRELTELTIAALRQARQRAVLVTGWGGLAPGALADDLYVAPEVPHDWLFPRVRAVVHHGGAGTFGAGLRAGKPTLVVAFFGDQPWWGEQAAALGVGPRPLLRRRLSAARLADAITRMLADERHAAAAERVGASIRAQDGARAAAERIGRYASSFAASDNVRG